MPWTKILIERDVPAYNDGKAGRKLTFPEAVKEALDQALSQDKKVFIMGQGVDDPGGMFGTTLNLHKKYGGDRVFDTPLSENGLTGIAIGAALSGMRPIYIHNRPDFLLLAMDQIVNHAAKWSYMFGGRVSVPLVIRAVIGRGWGSAAQHSQSLQGLFMHVPGLKLVMPSTPYDAKGLLITSIADNNPVIFIEHRWLYKSSGYVPEKIYSIPFGKGAVVRKGRDVTLVAISYMVVEAMRAAEKLKEEGIDVEVIDPRTLRPLDEELILNSVKKTGRLVIADIDWNMGGAGADISARVSEKGLKYLKSPVKRIASPDVPTPASHVLEEAFYPGEKEIINIVRGVVK